MTSKTLEKRGGRRYQIHAFTEQGVAMLSSVLRSETAIRVNIEIVRAFVRLRRAALVSSQVMALVEDLSKRVDVHDAVLTDIVESGKSCRVRVVVVPGRSVSPWIWMATASGPFPVGDS